tara:strand:+ start:360 stop:860 length:501 start_codon:yes stop_codon:yes gene_type:complete
MAFPFGCSEHLKWVELTIAHLHLSGASALPQYGFVSARTAFIAAITKGHGSAHCLAAINALALGVDYIPFDRVKQNGVVVSHTLAPLHLTLRQPLFSEVEAGTLPVARMLALCAKHAGWPAFPRGRNASLALYARRVFVSGRVSHDVTSSLVRAGDGAATPHRLEH